MCVCALRSGFIQVGITTLANLTARYLDDGTEPRTFFSLEDVSHIHEHIHTHTHTHTVRTFIISPYDLLGDCAICVGELGLHLHKEEQDGELEEQRGH